MITIISHIIIMDMTLLESEKSWFGRSTWSVTCWDWECIINMFIIALYSISVFVTVVVGTVEDETDDGPDLKSSFALSLISPKNSIMILSHLKWRNICFWLMLKIVLHNLFRQVVHENGWLEIAYLVLISFVSSLRIMKSWSKIPGRCFRSWESGTALNALNQPRWNCLANTCLLYMCLISTGIKPSISNVGCSATMFWK